MKEYMMIKIVPRTHYILIQKKNWTYKHSVDSNNRWKNHTQTLIIGKKTRKECISDQQTSQNEKVIYNMNV